MVFGCCRLTDRSGSGVLTTAPLHPKCWTVGPTFPTLSTERGHLWYQPLSHELSSPHQPSIQLFLTSCFSWNNLITFFTFLYKLTPPLHQLHLFRCSLAQISNQPITFVHVDMLQMTCWSSNQQQNGEERTCHGCWSECSRNCCCAVSCGEVNPICSHLLGEQHQSVIKETEQTNEESWLCSGDCSGADGADYLKCCSV